MHLGIQSGIETLRRISLLGVDHILTGIDHLLFVFALILLIRDRWMLVKTITAFTVAHSITLAGASLATSACRRNPWKRPSRSALHSSRANLRRPNRASGDCPRATPWVVAFAFGLLHGFGFAGALKEIGLPQTDMPLALFTFNLGVEAGQLMFVAAVLLSFKAVKAVSDFPPTAGRMVAAYGIGTVATDCATCRV